MGKVCRYTNISNYWQTTKPTTMYVFLRYTNPQTDRIGGPPDTKS